MELLSHYGLMDALREDDDPALWDAVLAEHWRPPLGPDMPLDQLSLRAGRAPEPEESRPLGSVLKNTDAFVFVRGDGGGAIRALPTELERKFVAPRHILEISRPSMEQEAAMVHHARIAGPRVASGTVYLWKRRGDGAWRPLHVVRRWST